MPQATDLTVKNAANANKTFTLLNPAAGSGGIAEWALREGTISSVFPKLTAMARPTKNASNVAHIKLKVPSSYTDTVTGLTNVGSAFELNVTASVPDNLPEAIKDDCVAYAVNIINHVMIKAMLRDAVSAT